MLLGGIAVEVAAHADAGRRRVREQVVVGVALEWELAFLAADVRDRAGAVVDEDAAALRRPDGLPQGGASLVTCRAVGVAGLHLRDPRRLPPVALNDEIGARPGRQIDGV